MAKGNYRRTVKLTEQRQFALVTISPVTPAPSELIIRPDNHLAYQASKAGTLSADQGENRISIALPLALVGGKTSEVQLQQP